MNLFCCLEHEICGITTSCHHFNIGFYAICKASKSRRDCSTDPITMSQYSICLEKVLIYGHGLSQIRYKLKVARMGAHQSCDAFYLVFPIFRFYSGPHENAFCTSIGMVLYMLRLMTVVKQRERG